MKKKAIFVLIGFIVFAAIRADAKFNKISVTTEEHNFLFVGANDLAKTPAKSLRVCAENSRTARRILGNVFKQWIDEISPTAQLKMFEKKRCELMGFEVINKPGRKYRTADSLATRARGLSIYRLINEGGANSLQLIKKFGAPAQYVVVVPAVAKSGLTLKDINLCVHPEQKDYYRKRAGGVANCHDQKQQLYVLSQYKKYPGPYQTNSVLFKGKEFEKLNKQGKFRPYVRYKLVEGKLVAMK